MSRASSAWMISRAVGSARSRPVPSFSSPCPAPQRRRVRPRACGNPLLQEVYAKTLAALFESEAAASLLYAEVDRREVDEIIASSTTAHRAIADALVAGRRKPTIAAVQSHLDDVERRMMHRLL